MANGYPISVIAGKKKYMQLVADGTVIHAGTINSCNPCIAAALATIEVMESDHTNEKLFRLGKRLMAGLTKIKEETGLKMLIQGPGPMFNVSFTELTEVHDLRDSMKSDKQLSSQFIQGMADEGIRIIGRGLWYISNAHTEADIDYAIDKAAIVLKNIARENSV